MGLDQSFLDLMTQTVKIAPTTFDDRGQSTPGSAVSWPAYVDKKNRLVLGSTGQQVVSSTRVIAGGLTGATVTSQITLPDGTTPLILSVETLSDTSGPLFDVIYCQ